MARGIDWGGGWPELWTWRSEPVDVTQLRAERDALSQMLRGMARRLRNYRRLAVVCPECGLGGPFRFAGEGDSVTECQNGCGGWPTDQRQARGNENESGLDELAVTAGAAAVYARFVAEYGATPGRFDLLDGDEQEALKGDARAVLRAYFATPPKPGDSDE